jgi:hypothetical protein
MLRSKVYLAAALLGTGAVVSAGASEAWDAPFTVQLGAFGANADTTVRYDAANGLPGTSVSFETDLGLSDSKTLPQLDFLWRINARHGVEGSYVALKRDGTRIISGEIRFGDQVFPFNASVDSTFESDTLRVAYRYSQVNDRGNELAWLAGVHYTKMRARLSTSVGSREEEASVDFPLPTLGVRAGWRFAEGWRLAGMLQALKLKYGDYDGALYQATGGVEWAFMRQAYAGLGYNYYKYELTQEKPEEHVRFDYRFDGPVFYLAWSFR